jgi:hypothetical protein
LGDVALAIDQTKVHREERCWTKAQAEILKKATTAEGPDGTELTFTPGDGAGSLFAHR